MTINSDLSPVLSSRPAVIVVEDLVTKAYLYAAWGAEQQYFTIIAAGGHQVVKGVVEDFRKHGVEHVFGFVDTDFDTPNVSKWTATSNPPYIFRSSYHEIENMLLDWYALAGCDLNHNNYTSTDISVLAKKEAAKQPWWLAYRKRLMDMQKLHGEGFPKVTEPAKITTRDEAVKYIRESPWCADLQSRTNQILDQAQLRSELDAAHQNFSNDLSTGKWLQTFSGKEIYKQIVNRIVTGRLSGTGDANVDLAKAVGRWQAENSKVPDEVIQLKDAIKQRLNI